MAYQNLLQLMYSYLDDAAVSKTLIMSSIPAHHHGSLQGATPPRSLPSLTKLPSRKKASRSRIFLKKLVSLKSIIIGEVKKISYRALAFSSVALYKIKVLSLIKLLLKVSTNRHRLTVSSSIVLYNYSRGLLVLTSVI